MKCPLCGYEFDENESVMICKGCALLGECNMIRCPNCGFETPAEAKLVKLLKKWRKQKSGDK